MSTQFAKPENALKRAEELISIDAKTEALNVLHSVITAKKFRNWQLVLEKIMIKHISLCVEQRKGRLAKDALHQYRVTCQQYNISSLEVVVKHFLACAEERAKEAQSKADKIFLDLIEDLEDEESMESIILSSVSGEDSKDRTDREVVTPWLKFLWETYRTVLEILRNNSKLEHLYQDTAQQAFNFCLKYKRHTEFRRLSEMLRTHLANIGKHTNQTQAINLSSPESLQLHLDTRFAQLNAATDLELWQEAFRSVEDIHGLVTLSKKTPKPQVMASYYQKLAQIFWVSENYLFHAYACNRFYTLSKNHNKNLTEEDSKQMASAVLLAAMSVPFDEPTNEDLFDYDVQKERNTRMATLLGFGTVPVTPTRQSLIDDLTAKNVIPNALPELQDLYLVMEKKFNPLQFVGSVKPKLDFIQNHPGLKQYAQPLQTLMFVRLLQQLSRVYETMKISEFAKLVQFLSFHEVEKRIVEAVKKKLVGVRIDHQNGALNFTSEALESEVMRNQLSVLSKNLQTAVKMMQPEQAAAGGAAKEGFKVILEGLQDEHQRILARKSFIEKKKESMEQLARKRAQLEDEERRKKAEKARQEELERLAELAKEREKAKQDKIAEAKTRKDVEAWLTLRGQEVDANKVDEIIDTLGGPADYIRKRIEEHEKEQSELHKRLKKLEKRLDWIERAKRDEELPLLREQYNKQKIEDEQFYKSSMQNFLKHNKEKHERDVLEKKRLARMIPDKEKFEAALFKRRQEVYEQQKKERDERMTVKRQHQREEMDRREKQEAERRAEQERQKKLREGQEKARKEEEEKLEEQRRKKEEELQRQRQQEERTREPEPAREEKYRPPRMREERPREERPRDFGPRGGFERGPERFERGPERGGFERGPERGGFEKGPERGGFERGPERGGFERGPERGGFERGPERGPERGGFEKGPERGGFERGPERGPERFERGPDRGGFERGPRDPERGGFERGSERGPERFERGPRDPERGGFERGPRDPERGGFERGPDRGPERGGFERGPRDPERGGFERGSERGGFERGSREPERGGFERGSRGPEGGFGRGPREPERGGFERGPREPERGGFERGPRDPERGFERGSREPEKGGFERGSRGPEGGFGRGPRESERGGSGFREERNGPRDSDRQISPRGEPPKRAEEKKPESSATEERKPAQDDGAEEPDGFKVVSGGRRAGRKK